MSWTETCKEAVIKALKGGKELWVSGKELSELVEEGYPVEVVRSLVTGREYIIRFKNL